ncbi:MAG: hypothetical protein AAF743_03835, partial [Planctomycetota bacterium]
MTWRKATTMFASFRRPTSYATRVLGFAAGLLLLASTTAKPAAAQVNLQFNVPVGTSYDFTSIETEQQTMTQGGQGMGGQQMQQAVRFEVRGSFKVLEVANGVPSRVEIAFDQNSGGQVQGPQGNQPIPFALAGQTVTASVDPQGNVAVQPAGNLDPVSQNVVQNLVAMDASILPGKPVVPGDTWAVNDPAALGLPPGSQAQLQFRFDGTQETSGLTVAVMTSQVQFRANTQAGNAEGNLNGMLVMDLATGLLLKAESSGQRNESGQGQDPMTGQPIQMQGTAQVKSVYEIQNVNIPGVGGGGGNAGG